MSAYWQRLLTRREVFGRMASGVGGMALAGLLPSVARGDAVYDATPKPPHFAPKAKAVIQLFMHGGPSQMDLFDPKPKLNEYHGKPPVESLEIASPQAAGNYLGTGAKFSRHGQSGQVISDMLPEISKHADEIAIIRSMYTEHNNHEQALWMMHTGMILSGRPSWGSWVVYGLGSENQNLPAYVVLSDPGGLPVDGIRNWSSGWLPPTYQGTPFRSSGPAVLNLLPRTARSSAVEQGRAKLLGDLNAMHLSDRSSDLELQARIASFELAGRMQLSAPEALDLSSETAATRRVYGLDDAKTASYGTRCLMARRLVERGVRFVQIFMAGQPWDTHGNNEAGTRQQCQHTDLPVAGLLTDLRARGLLDSTLVVWGGEFGRLPISQGGNGRDHNRNAFSLWLAGAGIRGGVCHGGPDDFGYRSTVDTVSVTDLHVTLLHLLGLDYKRLTFTHDTLEDRLTNVHEGNLVRSVLA
jgi:hypothetical protein